jgi:diguanylate cyclase (GGDEF)-like protein
VTDTHPTVKVLRFSDVEQNPLRGAAPLSLAGSLFRLTAMLSDAKGIGDVPQALSRVAKDICSMVGADEVGVLILMPGDDLLPARIQLVASHGVEILDKGLVSFQLGDGVAGRAADERRVIRIEDALHDPRYKSFHGQRTTIRSMLAVPMVDGGKLVGVLTASRKEVRGFHDDDEALLSAIARSLAEDMERGRLYRDAVTDGVTGLMNRQMMRTTLEQETERARRYQAPLSLALFDIDGFRHFNLSQGRAHGDRILRALSRRLLREVRQSDLLTRFGANEFALLQPMTPASGAEEAAQRIQRGLAEKPLKVAPADVPLAISAGVASLGGTDDEGLALLLRADQALGAAKRLGGRCVVVHDQLEDADPVGAVD